MDRGKKVAIGKSRGGEEWEARFGEGEGMATDLAPNTSSSTSEQARWSV